MKHVPNVLPRNDTMAGARLSSAGDWLCVVLCVCRQVQPPTALRLASIALPPTLLPCLGPACRASWAAWRPGGRLHPDAQGGPAQGGPPVAQVHRGCALRPRCESQGRACWPGSCPGCLGSSKQGRAGQGGNRQHCCCSCCRMHLLLPTPPRLTHPRRPGSCLGTLTAPTRATAPGSARCTATATAAPPLMCGTWCTTQPCSTQDTKCRVGGQAGRRARGAGAQVHWASWFGEWVGEWLVLLQHYRQAAAGFPYLLPLA